MTRHNFDLCDACVRTRGPHLTLRDVWLHVVRPVGGGMLNGRAIWPDGLPGGDGPDVGAPRSPTIDARGLCVHREVLCDGCDREVIGARFKCANCMDHDLCACTCLAVRRTA